MSVSGNPLEGAVGHATGGEGEDNNSGYNNNRNNMNNNNSRCSKQSRNNFPPLSRWKSMIYIRCTN